MEDIAIASVAAAVKEEEGASKQDASSSAAKEPAGLVERFETMHQRVAAGKAAGPSGARSGGLFGGSRQDLIFPAAWGSAAGGAVLGLALYFRPRPLLLEADGEGEQGAAGDARFSKLKLAGWVGGAFAVAAIAAAAARKFKR